MDIKEIEQFISFGRAKSVCIDISLADEFPGYVRFVTLQKNNKVQIEFHVYDMDEGGPIFLGEFQNMKTMIRALEIYLDKPIEMWENFSKSGQYPEEPEISCKFGDFSFTREDLKAGLEKMPLEGNFQLSQGYWSDLVKAS